MAMTLARDCKCGSVETTADKKEEGWKNLAIESGGRSGRFHARHAEDLPSQFFFMREERWRDVSLPQCLEDDVTSTMRIVAVAIHLFHQIARHRHADNHIIKEWAVFKALTFSHDIDSIVGW
jgi:hypothetical protein